MLQNMKAQLVEDKSQKMYAQLLIEQSKTKKYFSNVAVGYTPSWKDRININVQKERFIDIYVINKGQMSSTQEIIGKTQISLDNLREGRNYLQLSIQAYNPEMEPSTARV